MSLVSLLFNKTPTIAGYQFDAVLEDSFEASIELTRYPVESGVKVNDHRIINPMKYYLVGGMSNNPLRPIATDFVGGAISNLVAGKSMIAFAAGLSAGFLAGNAETRSSATLQFLLDLMIAGQPFDVDAVDIQLKNMLITRVSRERTPENENGLIFVAELQELITLDRLPNFTEPNQSQLPDGDPSKSSAAASVNRGQQVGKTPDEVVTYKVDEVRNIQGTPI